MSAPELIITKTREYVWRVNIIAEWFAYITAWHVHLKRPDGTLRLLAGGHDGGSNNRSGYAKVPRRKDAVAYAAGYADAAAGKVPFYLDRHGHRGVDTWKFRDREWYASGARHYFDDERFKTAAHTGETR